MGRFGGDYKLKLENHWTEVMGSCPSGHHLPATEAAGRTGSLILGGCRRVMLGFPRRSGTRFRGWHKPTCVVKSSRKGDAVSILSLFHHLSGCQVILTWKLQSVWHHTHSCWFSRKVMTGNSLQHSQGQVWVTASYSWGQSLTDHLSGWLQAGCNPDCVTQSVATILSPWGVWMGRSFEGKVCAFPSEKRAGPRGWEEQGSLIWERNRKQPLDLPSDIAFERTDLLEKILREIHMGLKCKAF